MFKTWGDRSIFQLAPFTCVGVCIPMDRIRKICQTQQKYVTYNFFNMMLKATCFDPLKATEEVFTNAFVNNSSMA
jgi:hypothetical protein